MLGNETNFFNRLAVKMALATVLLIIIVSLIVVLFASGTQVERLRGEAGKERQLKAAAYAENLKTTSRVMAERAREAMRVVTNTGNAKKVSLAPSVQLGERTVPNLMYDTASLINNEAFVSDLAERTGSFVSVYVLDKDEQFVNIATTLRDADKTKPVGEVMQKGTLAVNALKQGNSNYGIAEIFGKPYMRAVEPIKEVGGRIIGAWQVAYPVTLTDFGKQVSDDRILTDGFFAVVDSSNKVVAKSKVASDNLVAQIAQSRIAVGGETPLDNWRITRTEVPDWNYTVYAAYNINDPVITTEASQLLIWMVTTALLVAALLGGIIALLSLRITARLDDTVDVADKLAEGDLSVELKVNSGDEVGRLQQSMLKMLEYLRATAAQADQIARGDLSVKVEPRSPRDRFGTAQKNMLENILKLVQSQDERDQLQRSIMKLLDEVADVAEGDLTGQAEVTADATGAIADAFNYMIDELRDVVRRVKDAATQVGYSTNDIRATTEKLAEGSAVQAQQIALTSNAVEEITNSILEVSTSAAQSAEVAEQSVATAQNGAKAVQNNIAAMTRIRGQVQETAKRIKKLGERSQEIDEIVQIIDELADRTSILALNASLQAAAAGEAGRGFAAVAEEVERLADRSTQATQRIAALTHTIQLETKDVVASMEETIREVVDGSNLANDAGQALQEIEQVSNDLAKLIQSISQTARRQAQGSEGIARSMNDISQITELVATESKVTANSVKSLVSLTEKLRGSVATFKIPENKDTSGSLPDLEALTNGNTGELVKNINNGKPFSVPSINGHEITLN
jgi:methyl-accepting chemotaxis protein